MEQCNKLIKNTILVFLFAFYYSIIIKLFEFDKNDAIKKKFSAMYIAK